MAEPLRSGRHRLEHPVDREVPQRVDTERRADLLEVVVRRNELLATWRVDAVVARASHGRRAHAHVHFLCASRANERHEAARGGAAHDGVVDHHHTLAFEHLAHRVVLETHLCVARGLRGLDERAANVVIADERELVRQSALFGETNGRRVRRIRHAEHQLGAGSRAILRETPPKGAAGAVHRTAEDSAVRTCEVNVLEHAALELLRLEREDRALARLVNGDDLAGLDVALVRGAHDVERARLGREDRCAIQASQNERTPAACVARGEQRVAERHHEAECALDATQCISEPLLGQLRGRTRQQVNDDFRIHRRREDRPHLLELDAQLTGVRDVAVVRERDVPAARAHEHRLRVLDRRRARGAVARVPDRE